MMATVRGVNTRDECHWSHACKSFKRAGVGNNGILDCKFLSKTRTVRCNFGTKTNGLGTVSSTGSEKLPSSRNEASCCCWWVTSSMRKEVRNVSNRLVLCAITSSTFAVTHTRADEAHTRADETHNLADKKHARANESRHA